MFYDALVQIGNDLAFKLSGRSALDRLSDCAAQLGVLVLYFSAAISILSA